jgi:DNA-binding PadR family transcriptional regulator
MPVTRSATSHAVLALLSLRDWTTYELAKQVRRRLNWLWPRAERKLYEEPKALAAAGLATATREYTGQRPRTVYGITEDGRAALRDWLAAPSAPRSAEWEAMLKVFFADAGSSVALRTVLDGIERESRDRLAELAGSAAELHAGRSEFPHRLHLDALSLRLQVDQELAVLRWVPWARAAVAGWTDPTEPGGWDARAALADVLDRAGVPLPTR